MIWFLAEFQEAGIFKSMIRTLLASLCDIVYRGIIIFYQLFMAVGDATILTSNDVQKIFNRVGLILGIIMMFRLIFSFVQYLLDPDKITDKETGVGGLIKKIIIVVLSLGLVNWAFEKAFELQGYILKENVVGKVVLGISGGDENIDMKEYGTMFSYSLFSNFFYLNPELDDDAKGAANTEGCGENYFGVDGSPGTLQDYIYTFGDFENIHNCINVEGRDKSGYLYGNKIYYTTFHGLEALIVGGFVLWVLVMYTITLGVRVVKLAFLRIIAPVPILSYLSPKKSNGFSNWLKQSITTYLDLFIRIAIIYFAMLLISIIFSRGALLGTTAELAASSDLYKWFQIILVLGVLLFAKKMPEILGEIFPFMGGKGGLDFGLGLKSRTDFAGKGLVKRAAGGALGMGLIGAQGFKQGIERKLKDPKTGELELPNKKKRAFNTITGTLNGMGRGFVYGAKGGKIGQNLISAKNAQASANRNTNEYIANAAAEDGAGYFKRFMAGVNKSFGFLSQYDEKVAESHNLEVKINANKDTAEKAKAPASWRSAMEDRATGKIKGAGDGSGGDAKTVFSKNTPEPVLELLESKGIIGQVNGVWKIGRGKNVNGTAKVDDTCKNLFGTRYDKLDDEIRSYDNGLQQQIKTFDEQIALGKMNGNDVTRLIETRNNLENERINITEAEKVIRDASILHTLVGGRDSDSKYDDATMVTQMGTFITQSDESIKTIKSRFEPLKSAVSEEDKNTYESYSKGTEALDILQAAVDQLYNRREDSKDILSRVKSYFDHKDLPDFDVDKEDGKFDTKKIEINNPFDIFDNLSSYQEAISRSLEKKNIRLTTEKAIVDKEVADLKLSDDYSAGPSGKR